jgi:tetratricopeptide (TPR) repeat protein
MLKEGPEQQNDMNGLLQEAASAFDRGDYSQAEHLYKQILVDLEQNNSQESPESAICLQNLAEIYALSGQMNLAIPYYERLLSLGKQILGENHQDVMATALRLALAYESERSPEKADDIFKWVTNAAERNLGIAHPFTQKIRDAYFAFMSNKAPTDELDFRFALTPPPPPQQDPQYESLEFEGDEFEDLSARARANKKVSSYKRPTKIKNLRYGSEVAEEQVNTKVGMRKAWHHWKTVGVAVPALIAFVVITFMALTRVKGNYGVIQGDKASEQLVKLANFQSVDGVTGVKFNKEGFATLLNDIHQTKIPYTVLRGGFDDFKALLASGFTRRERWYCFDKDQLITEDGNILYPPGAPEQIIASKLKALKQFAHHYYIKTGCYPNDAKKWANETDLNYISPFTGRLDSPSSKTLNGTLDRDYLFPEITEGESAFDFLRSSSKHKWKDEPPGTPGKINCLALFVAQRCADGFKVVEFYGRGYDRQSRPLTGGKPGTYLMLALKDGKDLAQESDDHAQDTEECSVRPPDRIYVALVDTNLGWLHYGMQYILTFAALIFAVCWVFWESRRRIAEPKRFPQFCEIGFAVAVLLLIVVSIIHVVP